MRPKATLPYLQKYVKEATRRRGFDKETVEEKLILLVEEIGELARAIRKHKEIKMATDTKRANLEEELADCLFYLLDIANKFKINLEKAFWEKEGVWINQVKTTKMLFRIVACG